MRPLGAIGVALLALSNAASAAADSSFRIRQMTGNDVPPGKGQCDIRLQVDGEAEIAVRRDIVSIRVFSGREPSDDGSECNLPLPDRDIADFAFEVRESRGQVRLVAEPARPNHFTAIVNIRDASSGPSRYHFRLSWTVSGGRPSSDRGSGFAWNNAVHYASPGRGAAQLTGAVPERLSNATVDIDRGGRIQVSFRTAGGSPLNFSGTVIDRAGDTLKADVAAGDRMLRLRGPIYISISPRETVYRISLDATDGHDRLHLDWARGR